ncbi:Glycolipid sulfotransferase [Jannaschia aquimarina]|uniref:Glycolipid sulfotransferase n=2 Tax=Jannaschia aquimarina TaxID=935700 RepID=A0A0D1EP33_9RHOB|nr:Glycolipid sulfotransferase [Jannaschia aquimarina]SNT24369.1 aryl sulfotransferase [Jannaschia aquimarina]
MPGRTLYLGPLNDSRRWDQVEIRPDDVIVVTPPKCGTTQIQTIVALPFSADPEIETRLTIKMPWIDVRLREMPEVAARRSAMRSRRCLKSPTPLDRLPLDAHARYLCVFRYPLDAHVSCRAHMRDIPLRIFDH